MYTNSCLLSSLLGCLVIFSVDRDSQAVPGDCWWMDCSWPLVWPCKGVHYPEVLYAGDVVLFHSFFFLDVMHSQIFFFLNKGIFPQSPSKLCTILISKWLVAVKIQKCDVLHFSKVTLTTVAERFCPWQGEYIGWYAVLGSNTNYLSIRKHIRESMFFVIFI